MHRWLIEHRTMGALIRDWNENRVIRPRVKWTAAIMLVVIMSPPLLFGNFSSSIKLLSALVGLFVIVMIFSQNSRERPRRLSDS
jgi:uncharacterized membrane protein YbaN (DUF454 family)